MYIVLFVQQLFAWTQWKYKLILLYLSTYSVNGLVVERGRKRVEVAGSNLPSFFPFFIFSYFAMFFYLFILHYFLLLFMLLIILLTSSWHCKNDSKKVFHVLLCSRSRCDMANLHILSMVASVKIFVHTKYTKSRSTKIEMNWNLRKLVVKR